MNNDEYDRAFHTPLFPRFAAVQVMAAIISRWPINAATPESDAVEILTRYARENRFRC